MLQFLATVPSRGPVYLSRVCIVAARIVYVIPIPFRLSQISCFTLASNVSPLTLTISPMWGLGPVSVSPSAEGRSRSINSPVFPLHASQFCVI